MAEKRLYNVIVTEERTDRNGEVRKFYHRVGTAFEIDSGGMSVVLPEGISLSGRFAILPRKERDADESDEG